MSKKPSLSTHCVQERAIFTSLLYLGTRCLNRKMSTKVLIRPTGSTQPRAKPRALPLRLGVAGLRGCSSWPGLVEPWAALCVLWLCWTQQEEWPHAIWVGIISLLEQRWIHKWSYQ